MRGVIAGSTLGDGYAEFAGGGSHEDAGAEELGQRCGDTGSGSQDQRDTAGHGQDLGRRYHPRPSSHRARGADAGVLIVTGYSFQAVGHQQRVAVRCSVAAVFAQTARPHMSWPMVLLAGATNGPLLIAGQ